jgi:hypothetical protein
MLKTNLYFTGISMVHLFFLLLFAYSTLYPMGKEISFPSSQLKAFNKKSDLRVFTEDVQYAEWRDLAITKHQKKRLKDELSYLLFGLQPKKTTEFVDRYIQFDVVPAMHTENIGIIEKKITQFGPQIRNAILNSKRFPEIQPYLTLAALNIDARRDLLTNTYFNGDTSALEFFENRPCLQVLEELSIYEKKPKPKMLSSTQIWELSPEQLQVCNYIGNVIESNPTRPVVIPLSRSQEKIVQGLSIPILGDHAFICQRPIKDALKYALTEAVNQREIISCIAAICWSKGALWGHDDHTASVNCSVISVLGGLGVGAGMRLLGHPAGVRNSGTALAISIGILDTFGWVVASKMADSVPLYTPMYKILPLWTAVAAARNVYTAVNEYPTIKTIDQIKEQK